MSVIYAIVGFIVIVIAVYICIGVGKLTKYLGNRYDSGYYDSDDVPSLLLGVFVIVGTAIVIGLLIALSCMVGESIINALNK